MEKLTKSETIEVEKQEMIRAKKQALLQEDQRQKRLWYLPIIGEYLVLILFVMCMYWMVFLAGFITGESAKTCPTVSCPIVQSVCELPETGATIE